MQCNRCDQFEADLWDRPETSLAPDLPQRLTACPRCAAIYEDFRLLQQAIRVARCPTDAPSVSERVVARFSDAVRVQSAQLHTRKRYLLAVSATAAAVLLLIVVAQRAPLWNAPAQAVDPTELASNTGKESSVAMIGTSTVDDSSIEPLSHTLSNAYAALARETRESVGEVTAFIGDPAAVPGKSALTAILPQMESLQGLGSVTSVSRPFEPMGREVRDAFAFLLPRASTSPDSQMQ